MASQKSLDALEAANKALQEIQLHMEPLLDILIRNPEATSQQRAVAQVGMALALGTIRFVGPKLLPMVSGHHHPLQAHNIQPIDMANSSQIRSELNHIRKLLVTLQSEKRVPTRKTAHAHSPVDFKAIKYDNTVSTMRDGSISTTKKTKRKEGLTKSSSKAKRSQRWNPLNFELRWTEMQDYKYAVRIFERPHFLNTYTDTNFP